MIKELLIMLIWIIAVPSMLFLFCAVVVALFVPRVDNDDHGTTSGENVIDYNSWYVDGEK